MISREEVTWLYRCLLNRLPESEGIVDAYVRGNYDFASCRRALLTSEEFRISEIKRGIVSPVRYCSCDYPAQRYIKPPKNTLALACILKNEAQHIIRMLKSALPLVDFVALLDTGSTDRTLSLASTFLHDANVPHRILEASFVDFSHARNLALDMVPHEIVWNLMLDGDEYLIESDFAPLCTLLHQTQFDGWQLPRYNFNEDDLHGSLYDYPDFQRRLIKNKREIRYTGRVHESVQNVSEWGFAPIDLTNQGGQTGGPHIHHTALVNITFEKAHGKRMLYEGLA